MASSSNEEEEQVQELTDTQLKERIFDLFPKVNVEETGLKQFIKLLSKEVGYDVKPKRDFVKECVIEAMKQKEDAEKDQDDDDDDDDDENDGEENDESENDEQDDDGFDDEEEPLPKKGKKGGGLSAEKPISKELAAFLGQGDTMARTAVVKAIWAYIREHELQDPNDKREILLDKAMQKVFGCKKFNMFSMNKYVSAHIHPFRKVDLTSPSSSSSGPSRPRAAAASRKRSNNNGNRGGSGGSAKKRKKGTQPPYRLSDDLSAVVGTDVLPRPQVVSQIWTYIKSKGLQNPNDKRQILCDELLSRVMSGKKKVTMFSMNQHIGKHLLEKLDRSLYAAAEDEEDEASDESD